MAAVSEPVLPATSRFGPPIGAISQLRRPLSLLDIIPTQVMDSGGFHFAQESGDLDTAKETAESSIKPEADVVFTDAEVVPQTIAVWLKVARQSLGDVPALANTLQSRLLYSVMRTLETAIVSGDGVGSNLLGLFPQLDAAPSGALPAGDNAADSALTALTDVTVAGATPNAVVLHPADRARLLSLRAITSGEYLSMGPFVSNPSTLWGVPCIESAALPVGTGLVGDFTAGRTLWVREGVNARISDAADDDFTRNRITMLCEGRWGFALWRKPAFRLVDVSA
jgi:HK97 family phage major capsid protein